jgi:epoxyqueuosine reductase
MENSPARDRLAGDDIARHELAGAIKARARALGFDLVGITDAVPSAFRAEYRDWLARGYAGEMDYLQRNVERRLDPRELLPGARSIVVVGQNYYADPPSPASPDPSRAVFARYARGDDYHDVMGSRLRSLLKFIREHVPEAEGRVYVDAGPILEREVAQRAGLGWFGKNTMLINTRRGSYFLLGEIVTTVALPVDTPARGGCGTCRRCLDACPTQAIVAPYLLDARRCISYLTIELKGPIPEDLQPIIGESGNRIFGCDICQEVCPINRTWRESQHPTLTPTTEPAFQPRQVTMDSSLDDLAAMSEEEFRERFRGSPVKRAKYRGQMRNVEAALVNRSGAESARSVEFSRISLDAVPSRDEC